MKMEVELPSLKHASVISSRRPRIQYSFIKLACPPEAAGHTELMDSLDRIVIQLRYDGDLIAEGTCPFRYG